MMRMRYTYTYTPGNTNHKGIKPAGIYTTQAEPTPNGGVYSFSGGREQIDQFIHDLGLMDIFNGKNL